MKKQPKLKNERKHYLFDCQDFTLGRLASRAAFILRGKHKADFSPNEDKGDFVVLTNSRKIRVTGRKRMNKLYHRFSGYPSGISTRTMDEMLKKNPEVVLREAIYGMLPKNNLRDKMMKRIKIFADESHNLKVDLVRVK